MFQAKENIIKRQIAGETILVPVGSAVKNFNGIITLNDAGTVLWDALLQPCTEDDLTEAVLEQFEVSENQARKDIHDFLERGISAGIILVL